MRRQNAAFRSSNRTCRGYNHISENTERNIKWDRRRQSARFHFKLTAWGSKGQLQVSSSSAVTICWIKLLSPGLVPTLRVRAASCREHPSLPLWDPSAAELENKARGRSSRQLRVGSNKLMLLKDAQDWSPKIIFNPEEGLYQYLYQLYVLLSL